MAEPDVGIVLEAALAHAVRSNSPISPYARRRDRTPPAQNHPPRCRPTGTSRCRLPVAVEAARSIEKLGAAAVTFEWVSDRSRYAGTALHGFLQRIAREGLDAWDETDVRSRRALYRARAGESRRAPGRAWMSLRARRSGPVATPCATRAAVGFSRLTRTPRVSCRSPD